MSKREKIMLAVAAVFLLILIIHGWRQNTLPVAFYSASGLLPARAMLQISQDGRNIEAGYEGSASGEVKRTRLRGNLIPGKKFRSVVMYRAPGQDKTTCHLFVFPEAELGPTSYLEVRFRNAQAELVAH